MTDRADAIHQELEPVVQALGLTIYDVTVEGGPSTTLRVVLDREGGVDLDAIEQVTARSVRRARRAAIPSTAGTCSRSEPRARASAAHGRALRRRDRQDRHGQDPRRRRPRGAPPRRARRSPTPTGSPSASTAATPSSAFELETVEQARTVFEWGPAPKPGKGSRPGAPRRKRRPDERPSRSDHAAHTPRTARRSDELRHDGSALHDRAREGDLGRDHARGARERAW